MARVRLMRSEDSATLPFSPHGGEEGGGSRMRGKAAST